MTLVTDSVDNCGDTYAATALTLVGWDSTTIDSIVGGRAGGGAIRLNGGTIITPHQLTKVCSLGTEFTWHCGLMIEAAPGSDTVLVRFYEGSTLHIDVRVTSTRKLKVTRNGTSLGTGTPSLTAGVWYQFAIHVKVHDTTGEIHTWIDNVADLSLTGQDTRNGGTSGTIDKYMIRGEFGYSVRYDDIHAWTGNANKGMSRIVGCLAASDGAHTDWTPSTGTDHFAMVDDASPDSDSTYVSSDTTANRDSYNMAPLGIDPGATIYALVARMVARKLDIGTRTLALFVRPVTTDYDGADQSPAYGYTQLSEAWETNPATAAAWTPAEIDATEVGVLDNT